MLTIILTAIGLIALVVSIVKGWGSVIDGLGVLPRVFGNPSFRSAIASFLVGWLVLFTAMRSRVLGEHRNQVKSSPGMFETVVQDLRFGLRMLVRRPLFALMSVGVVALGIAANTAIVSVVRTALAERLPFREVDRLMMVWQEDMAHDRDRITLTPAEYVAYRDSVHGFASVAAARPTAYTATGDNGAFVLQGARVSVNLLSTLGTAPAAGRDFRQDEDRPGNDNVALLSHSVWVRQFAQDRSGYRTQHHSRRICCATWYRQPD